MAKILWKAQKRLIKNSNLKNYELFVKKKYKFNAKGKYLNLLKWSINNPKNFWKSIWDYSEVLGIKKDKFLINPSLSKSKFLLGSKLNYAENLLSNVKNKKNITFISENGFRQVKTWKNIYQNTSKIVNFLNSINLKNKDRVAAYLPNISETVEFFLASSTIGTIWSSCSPDFGAQGVIERFSQINPKILIISDRYFYNGKQINVIKRLPEIISNIKV